MILAGGKKVSADEYMSFKRTMKALGFKAVLRIFEIKVRSIRNEKT